MSFYHMLVNTVAVCYQLHCMCAKGHHHHNNLGCCLRRLQEMHSLIDAWKRHLADEATLHRTREDNWQQLQSQWETIEKEMQNEILT